MSNSTGGALPLGPPVQIAYAVTDVAQAAAGWAATFGAGPFFVRSHIEVTDVVHRGVPATFDHTSAYGQWGPVMVELVHDHGIGPSVVRDMFDEGRSGLHHLGYFVADAAATIEALDAAGYPLVMSATTRGGVRFHFVDATVSHGHMFELYEPTDHLRGFYAMVAEAAAEWDGRDPVRWI